MRLKRHTQMGDDRRSETATSQKDAIGNVFVTIREQISCIVARIVPPKDIEDIVQETYVRVCQVTGRRKLRSPRAFMFKTARNLALDHIRRHEFRFAVSAEENPELGYGEARDGGNATYEQAAADEEFAEFCDAVRQLPVQCRRAFVLKKVYGLSQKEIAQQLGISESTVEKHVALGLRRCAEQLLARRDADDGRPARARRAKRKPF